MMETKLPEDDAGSKKENMPLFLFFSSKVSGSSFMRHKIMDIAVHCWPYNDNAPVFYSQINHGGKMSRNSSENSSRVSNSTATCVFEDLLHWIDETISIASSELGISLYPVLLAHQGDTFQFLFLFRMLENYGIDAQATLEVHKVHYADPMPLLKQYKDAKHPWLVQSRSLGLGSLLNDWFPAQFSEADLLYTRSRGALTVKLYTQCALHWLLYRVPIYGTTEWIEFYKGERFYQEDKLDLQKNLPATIAGFQRKFAIKNLLKHGYNWSLLIDLFKSCGSPQHFRQELRDIDLKTGAARKITLTLDGMKLTQDGSREYKVRIKSHMAYAKFYHLTDARGRYFILRVANVLPPCIYSLPNPHANQWKVPENLLQINLSEIWDAKVGCVSSMELLDTSEDVGNLQDGEFGGQHGGDADQSADQPIELLEDTDSDADWEASSDQEIQGLEDGEVPDCFLKEPQPVRSTTTLQKGVPGFNPFLDTSQDWVFEEVTENKEKCEEKIPIAASNSKSTVEELSTLTKQMALSGLNHSELTNQTVSSRWFNSTESNQRVSARAYCPSSADRTPLAKSYNSANQLHSNWSHHLPSANQARRWHHSTSANQTGSKQFHHPPPAYHGSPAGYTRRSQHPNSTNHNGSKQSHHPPPTNHSSPAGFSTPRTANPTSSANQNGPKQSCHPPLTNHSSRASSA